tara:strand:+ start:146 stop:310 length:165 start_codon:yes stop_codon:yes gene_type:complete
MFSILLPEYLEISSRFNSTALDVMGTKRPNAAGAASKDWNKFIICLTQILCTKK